MKEALMDRRTILRMAGMAALGLGLSVESGCSFMRPPHCTGGERRRSFARVNASPERVTHIAVGHRPYRASGFVVRSERFGDKTIIHNYGHGGGGVSLSWGTARLAVEEALQSGQQHFAVIGCGCVGLATACLLQQWGFNVTIYAKDIPPHTTSNAAGAIWSPFAVADLDDCSLEFITLLQGVARLSHHYFQDIIGDEYGVRWIESYALSNSPIEPSPETSAIRDLYPERKALASNEHPFSAPYAERFETMLIDMPVYLNALMRDVTQAGGKIVVREFCSREDVLGLSEPVIVNCAGLGARTLFNDEELLPIKGQLVILMPQPEVDYLTVCRDAHLIMLPRRDGILLGGTFQPGEWSLDPDAAETSRILEDHRRFFDAMKCES